MRKIHAELFALGAAGLNGTIGVLTKFGLENTSHHAIAFWKCFGAFLLLLAFTLPKADYRHKVLALGSAWKQIALLSFLGIFCLYFFETWAFNEASIPLVSFLIYAAGIVTLLLSVIFLNEKITPFKLLALIFILLGVALLYLFEGNISGSHLGIALALLGGLGYALFIFFSKYFKIQGGLPLLVWLFGLGSIYLFIPYFAHGIDLPSWSAWIVIVALILLPTIGGFYCTTKAVEKGEAGKVQIIETTVPLFSAFFAFLCFGDLLSPIGFAGAACIMLGLLVAIKR